MNKERDRNFLIKRKQSLIEGGHISGDINLLIDALSSEREVIPKEQSVLHPESIQKYTHYLYKIINSSLRNGVISRKIDNIIVDMEDSIAEAPVYEDIILYRGVYPKINLKVGDKFSDRAFMSKTSDYNIVTNFSKVFGTRFFLHYPKKTRQLYIAEYSEHGEEKEFLSFTGEEFVVKAVYDIDIGDNYIYAEFVGTITSDAIYDESKDQEYEELEKMYPLLEEIIMKDYLFVKVKDYHNTPEQVVTGRPYKESDFSEELPIYLLKAMTKNQLFTSLMKLFYLDELLALYILSFDEYQIFDVLGKQGDLEVESKQDSFTVASLLVYDNYINITPQTGLPKLELIWEKTN